MLELRVKAGIRVRVRVRVKDRLLGYEAPGYEKETVRNVWKPPMSLEIVIRTLAIKSRLK